uniref:DUF4371 domain-containing protein n=1 Tax=Kalanchoe fedtschenkoi TaxID=63787 RepID=A0A7N0UFZ5_KALFE
MNNLNIDEILVVLENLPAHPGLRRKISEYHLNIRDEVRRAYILKGSWYASAHNLVIQKCKDFMKRGQHIDIVMHKISDKSICNYHTRLLASKDCVRFLLCQGLSFCGHDQSESSSNKGNFLELLNFVVDHNESIAPNIQKDILNVVTQEVVSTIIMVTDGDYFAILIDESRDERIFGIVHVSDTTAVSLKGALDSLFSKNNLTMSSVRGQGYDGASNMRGEFSGLKTLIMKENSSAFYVHCFAHQLQLTHVLVVKNHDERQDMLRDEHAKINRKAIEEGELVTRRGLNQEINLKKVANTRWQLHYGVLLNLMVLFPSIINVLDAICESGATSEHQVEAKDLLEKLQTFNFLFRVMLIKNVLGVTNELSQALQKKDQDIFNAMDLLRISKKNLQIMRNNDWDSCKQHDIPPIDMDDRFVQCGSSRRKAHDITNMHHYHVEWYYSVIDMQILELKNHFDETKHRATLIKLDNYIIDMRCEDGEFLKLNGIIELAQMLVRTKKNMVHKWVYLLVKLSLMLPVATAERAFSVMNIIKIGCAIELEISG